MKKYLKGFANLGFFEVLTNTLSAYACGTDRATLIGASSCSPTDNKTDFQSLLTMAFMTAVRIGQIQRLS